MRENKKGRKERKDRKDKSKGKGNEREGCIKKEEREYSTCKS